MFYVQYLVWLFNQRKCRALERMMTGRAAELQRVRRDATLFE